MAGLNNILYYDLLEDFIIAVFRNIEVRSIVAVAGVEILGTLYILVSRSLVERLSSPEVFTWTSAVVARTSPVVTAVTSAVIARTSSVIAAVTPAVIARASRAALRLNVSFRFLGEGTH